MKNKMLVVLSAIAICLLLISTIVQANSDDYFLQEEKSSSLLVWTIWSDPLPTSYAQAYADYETAHPEIDVEFYFPVDFTTELDAAFEAGLAPDIIIMGAENIGSRVFAGQIINLGTLGVTEASLMTAFGEANTATVLWRGGVYGIPMRTEAIALIYNKDLVSNEYLPGNRFDFNDLKEKAQKFLVDKGKPLICNQGMGNFSEDAYHVAPIFFGFGVPAYIDNTGKAYANTVQAINAGTWIDIFHIYSYDENDYGSCNDRLINEEVGMWWSGPWAISGLKSAGLNYGIVPMGKPFNGVQVHMITTAALARGNAYEALDLIQTITNKENSIQYALIDSVVPANQAALLDPAVQALPDIKAFGAAAQESVPFGNEPFHYCQWAPVGQAVQRIWTNIQTPTQALNQAQQEIELCVQDELDLMYPNKINLPMVAK